MELEDDVDVSEFGPEVLRRQQVQSYLIKVLVNGLDDATKIQYYHRFVYTLHSFFLPHLSPRKQSYFETFLFGSHSPPCVRLRLCASIIVALIFSSLIP